MLYVLSIQIVSCYIVGEMSLSFSFLLCFVLFSFFGICLYLVAFVVWHVLVIVVTYCVICFYFVYMPSVFVMCHLSLPCHQHLFLTYPCFCHLSFSYQDAAAAAAAAAERAESDDEGPVEMSSKIVPVSGELCFQLSCLFMIDN